MKKRTRARSSGLFLLELIIAIMFFTAASAVCVEFFVKSHTMSQDSADLNFAVNECSSVAEIVRTSASEKAAVNAIKGIYNETEIDDETVIYFDNNMEICDSSDKDVTYMLIADFTSKDDLIKCDISMEKEGSVSGDSDSNIVIYDLSVKHAVQEVND